MDTWGYVILIAGALLVGVTAHYLTTMQFGYESLISALGAGIAAYTFSEHELYGLGQWGTEYLGIAVFPAIIVACVAALAIEGIIVFIERSVASGYS